MVLPLVVAGAAMAVSALMQYYNSEKARGATKEQLDKIEAMFNKVKPPDFDMKVYDDPKLASQIPAAAYDFSRITPEEYKLVQNISPESAPYVAEKAPQVAQASQAATAGRTAQLEALQRYKSIAAGEHDPQFQQMILEASRKARGDAGSQRASIIDSFARRGMSGGGAEMAAQQGAASDDMQREAMSGQAAAADSYRNRLEALSKGAQLGGQVRDSEMGEQQNAASVVNDYNQRTAKRYQDWQNARADSIYQARVMQEQAKQRISDANVAGRNKAATDNRDNHNALVGKQQNDDLERRRYWLDLLRHKNATKQQAFGNEMDIFKGKAGIANNNIDYMNQRTRDQNQAIQGVGNAVAGVAMYADGKTKAPESKAAPMPVYGGDPYDEGTTPGHYRYAKSDIRRTV
jgi:hypothetical protein